MQMTVFDMVFAISDAIISFSSIFWNFVTMPLGETISQMSMLKNIPLLGNFLIKSMGFLIPLTPLDILAGGGFAVIMLLVIIKKVVPIA